MELKPVETTLADYEQRSWWISLESRRQVAFEAAGRRLTDLRLWRDGSWLHAAEPESEVTMPQPGRPLRVMRLAADLAAGPLSPLRLRRARRALGRGERREPAPPAGGESRASAWRDAPATSSGRAASTASWWRARRRSSTSRCRRRAPISFTATPWTEASPFVEGEERGAIDKKTNPPEASLRVEGRTDGLTLVTVRGEAGQPYVLTHFELRDRYPIRGSGSYWIATIPSADLRDAVDQTGLLLDDASRAPLRSARDRDRPRKALGRPREPRRRALALSSTSARPAGT